MTLDPAMLLFDSLDVLAPNPSPPFWETLYSPFSQRVWIALEAKGLAYQYVETDPMQRPALMPLLEANPRGRVPVIQQGGWACAESAVILEYV